MSLFRRQPDAEHDETARRLREQEEFTRQLSERVSRLERASDLLRRRRERELHELRQRVSL